MYAPLKAGAIYFMIVFGLGFLLGTIRVLVLVPQFGEVVSTIIEGPFMLGASWIVSGVLIKRFSIKARLPDRLIMGGFAFLLIMIAELALGILLFDRTIHSHFDHYATLAGGLGLAGQVMFAAFPALRLL